MGSYDPRGPERRPAEGPSSRVSSAAAAAAAGGMGVDSMAARASAATASEAWMQNPRKERSWRSDPRTIPEALQRKTETAKRRHSFLRADGEGKSSSEAQTQLLRHTGRGRSI